MANPALQAESSTTTRPKPQRIVSRARATIEEAIENIDAPIKWPTEIKRALEQCTSKQRHLAICLASGIAEIPAYRLCYEVRADREDRTMHGEASVTCNHTAVLNARSILEDWIDRDWLLETKGAIQFSLAKLYEIASESPKESAQLGAVRDIMRYHGAFINRTEVKHIHTLDTSQTDALLSTMAELIGLATVKPTALPEPARVDSIEFSSLDSTD